MTELKKYTVLAGLTIPQLAKQMGVSRSTIYNWATKKNLPTWSVMTKLADILEVDPEQLFTRDEIGWARITEGRK